MAYTSTQLAALRAAMATGALTVSFEGRSVTYRSLDDMRRAEAIMAAELEPSSAFGTTANPNFTRIEVSRG